MKICIKCGTKKPLDEYHASASAKDGRRNECKTCRREQSKAWNAPNSERKRRENLLYRYGITPEHHDSILAAQMGRCACCGTDSPGGRQTKFHIDHDHATGKIRGLLCHSCNLGIGALGDNVEGVTRALMYLQRAES